MAAREQARQLEDWLEQQRPSQVNRSQGVGWMAVKLKDKGRKVVEAKVAWEELQEKRSMREVNLSHKHPLFPEKIDSSSPAWTRGQPAGGTVWSTGRQVDVSPAQGWDR